MKKLSNINEGVIGDILKRASSNEVRTENEVDVDGLVDYINDNYIPTEGNSCIAHFSGSTLFGTTVSIQFFSDSVGSLYIRYKGHEHISGVYVTKDFMDALSHRMNWNCEELYDKIANEIYNNGMKDIANVKYDGGVCNIEPADKKYITNQFVLNVIDTFLNMLKGQRGTIRKK